MRCSGKQSKRSEVHGGGGRWEDEEVCNGGRATKETQRVWDVPSDLAVSNAFQPRIRRLRSATDWQLAPGLDYTLEWQRLNKGNAWREAEGTHRAENQFITLSVRGRTGRQDRDTAREEENGLRGEIKVEKEWYKDKCDWLRHCKPAGCTASCSIGVGSLRTNNIQPVLIRDESLWGRRGRALRCALLLVFLLP